MVWKLVCVSVLITLICLVHSRASQYKLITPPTMFLMANIWKHCTARNPEIHSDHSSRGLSPKSTHRLMIGSNFKLKMIGDLKNYIYMYGLKIVKSAKGTHYILVTNQASLSSLKSKPHIPMYELNSSGGYLRVGLYYEWCWNPKACLLR